MKRGGKVSQFMLAKAAIEKNGVVFTQKM